MKNSFLTKKQKRNLIISIIFLSLMCLVPLLNAQTVELKPYLGIAGNYSAEFENPLTNNSSFAGVRGGLFTTTNLTSWLRLKWDFGGEWNNTKSFPLSAKAFEFGTTYSQLKIKIGQFATPLTCFRPHPLSLPSQAEYISQQEIPGGTYNITTSYSFKNGGKITGGIAERGKYFGDSTEYTLVFEQGKQKFGFYFLDGSPGTAITLNVFERLTIFGYCNEYTYSGYIEYIAGKEKQSLFAIDFVDNTKTKTYLELIYLHLFGYESLHLSNCMIGTGITKDGINLYFFTQIF